jgi:tetratricopeptide (TPR) repeat protein
MPTRGSARRPDSVAILAACIALGGLFASAGCEELESRRQIQRGNEQYNEGRYQKAVDEFEPALARTPDLAIGHHNAGLAYYQLFEPGNEAPANRAIAEKASEHLQIYLQANPDDSKIISLLTQIWLDSGQYEKALAYWEAVLAKDPADRGVMIKLANINRQAGRYDEALAWHEKRAALEPQTEGKVNAYIDMANLAWSRLNKSDLVDAERVAVADLGIAALQKAEALDPNHAQVQSLLGSMFQHRGLGHGALWARTVESASQRHHQLRFVELQKAAQAASAGATAPAGPAR